MLSRIIRPIILALATLLAFNLAMLFNEGDYIFLPDRQLHLTPAAIGLRFEPVTIASSQEARLSGWFIPATTTDARVVLHLHGNAGNIGDRLPLYERWHRMGLSVLAFDYRGYGSSSGTPYETGLYADAEAAWLYLVEERHISPGRIIIAGRSLGAAVASRLAAGQHAAGLVLETPFSSTPAMAAYHYPFFLLRPLIRNRFATVDHVREVHMPLLILAAREDAIVPAAMTAAVFTAATPPKQLVQLAGDHNDFDLVSEKPYIAAWRAWLQQLGTGERKKEG